MFSLVTVFINIDSIAEYQTIPIACPNAALLEL